METSAFFFGLRPPHGPSASWKPCEVISAIVLASQDWRIDMAPAAGSSSQWFYIAILQVDLVCDSSPKKHALRIFDVC